MNSTVLALLLVTSLNTFPDRAQPAPQGPVRAPAPSLLKATDQASRLAAKGRLPKAGLQLRLDDRIALAAK